MLYSAPGYSRGSAQPGDFLAFGMRTEAGAQFDGYLGEPIAFQFHRRVHFRGGEPEICEPLVL
ncbi:hypothetical protein [Nocardia sp. NPDC059228]|uniref:hypothetical protein n=1 Tax=Nocardia sp. NPDC059228 TaxID=3346777 RepID=UPI003693756F